MAVRSAHDGVNSGMIFAGHVGSGGGVCKTGFLSLAVSANAGMGGTGGVGEQSLGLGGGERYVWIGGTRRARLLAAADNDGAGEGIGSSLSHLFEPNSSPSTHSAALALSSIRSNDREWLRVLSRRGEPMRRGGMGGDAEREDWEVTRRRLRDILLCNAGGEGNEVGKSWGEGMGGGGDRGRV
jgi:hypothetical protein